jgi:hypothetical protein
MTSLQPSPHTCSRPHSGRNRKADQYQHGSAM